jgi:curved DNA-binding protein CbpA
MKSPTTDDPFKILGVAPEAGEAEIRARYLALVKQHPPDRDPEKFQIIHAAYNAARNPLTIAARLIACPSDDPPDWQAVLDAQKRNPPRLTPALLLSLGNRLPENGSPQTDAAASPPVPR